MSKSQVTCGMEIQSILKILIIIDLVVSILWRLVDLLAGISIVADPTSKKTKEFIAEAYAELDTVKEDEVKGFGFGIIIASIFLLFLTVCLFYLIFTGIKKRNYTKCCIWFIIYVVLQILNVIGVMQSALIDKNIVDLVIWIVQAPLNFYLLLVGFMYLRELKREVFGGTQNYKPQNKEIV